MKNICIFFLLDPEDFSFSKKFINIQVFNSTIKYTEIFTYYYLKCQITLFYRFYK